MSAAIEVHPSPTALRNFGLGLLHEPERSQVEEHISKCSTCCDALQNVDADTLVELARDAAATPAPLDTPVHPDLPSELVDHPRYRILHALGEGGMGTVFKAEHKVMGRVVALKVINRKLTARAEVVERFRTEVKAAAQLSHPNIVTAHDAEEANGLHFLVMEFVEGVSLDRYVARRGRLPVALACQFIRQAALGLQHAHEKGLVHRDIKPHNLMITRKGQLKILDFGLARLAQDAGAINATVPNLVLGTPDFLAPEQARNSHTVDIRADLYALGCTFYFLLTGRTPFGGDNVYEKMVAHTTVEAEPITTYRTDVPAEVEAIVYKLLAKKPEDRYSTPAELASALAAASKTGVTIVPEPAPPAIAAVHPTAFNSDAATALMPRETPEEPSRRMKRRRKKRGFSNWPMLAAIALPVLLLSGLIAAAVANKSKLEQLLTSGTPSTGSSTGIRPTERTAAHTSPGISGPARPVSRKVLLLAPPRGLWYRDLADVRSNLRNNGIQTIVASTTLEPFQYKPQSTAPASVAEKADTLLNDVKNIDQYDALVLVGADVEQFLPGNFYRRDADQVKSLIDKMLAANRPVAAICLGQKVLVYHGFLAGKSAAKPLYFGFFKDCPSDILWDDKKKVVRSDNLITASSDEDAAAMVSELCRAIGVSP